MKEEWERGDVNDACCGVTGYGEKVGKWMREEWERGVSGKWKDDVKRQDKVESG